jgi:ABC-type Na+ efflux pump permease subunit
MVNATHFRVLLKKNFLTLKRKWGFALFFILLPIISMGIFTAIKFAISKGERPEGHNFDCNLATNYVSRALFHDK